MASTSGNFLEWYRIWYLGLPKLIRIAVLPAIVAMLGAALQIFELSNDTKYWGGLILLCLLAWSAYNQLAEADELDDYKKAAATFAGQTEFWKDKYRNALFLNNLIARMVQKKSELWRDTMLMAGSEGPESARLYVRTKNSLKNNIDRVITGIHEAFKLHADVAMHEEVRIAYLVPNESGTHLELKSWCNNRAETPRTISKHPERYSRDGKTLASFVWAQTNIPIFFIDDVEAYCNAHRDDTGIFSYIDNGQISTIRSIFCYRVTDGLSGNCLGVISVDCNTKGMFQGRISEEICKEIVSAAEVRIVYETRFALMKNSLGPYDRGANHVGN